MIFGLNAPSDIVSTDFSSMGLNPYVNSGDPVVSLVAQVNRFAKHTVALLCGPRNYLPAGALPLPSKVTLPMVGTITPLTEHAAAIALLILIDSMSCVEAELIDRKRLAILLNVGDRSKAVEWLLKNLSDTTVRIAQFADSLGLDPAPVGITKRDPNIKPKPKTSSAILAVVLLGVLAVGAVVITRRMR